MTALRITRSVLGTPSTIHLLGGPHHFPPSSTLLAQHPRLFELSSSWKEQTWVILNKSCWHALHLHRKTLVRFLG